MKSRVIQLRRLQGQAHDISSSIIFGQQLSSERRLIRAMSTVRTPTIRLYQVRNQLLEPAVPVYLPHNLSTLEFHSLLPSSPSVPSFTFPALQNWLTRLIANFKLQENESHPNHKHPYKLCELDIQAVDWFWKNVSGKEDKLGFMKIQSRIETDPYIHEGEKEERADWLPGAVFLRGGSVAILVRLPHLTMYTTTSNKTKIIVQPADASGDDEKHVILTVQPRTAAGSLAFTEIPAGMLDGDSFKGSAANEIAEEAELTVNESDLINMSELASEDAAPQGSSDEIQESIEAAMYPSVGACDEFIPLFLCQKRLSRRHMEWLKGKATGLRDEGENITLRLVPLNKAWREASRDAKALAALALYAGLKDEQKLPEMPIDVETEPKEVG
jgi:ADP-sugar diphosphatase